MAAAPRHCAFCGVVLPPSPGRRGIPRRLCADHRLGGAHHAEYLRARGVPDQKRAQYLRTKKPCLDCGSAITRSSQRCRPCRIRHDRADWICVCEGCGSLFVRGHGGHNARRFCTRACAWQHYSLYGRPWGHVFGQRKKWPASRIWPRRCAYCREWFAARAENSLWCPGCRAAVKGNTYYLHQRGTTLGDIERALEPMDEHAAMLIRDIRSRRRRMGRATPEEALHIVAAFVTATSTR